MATGVHAVDWECVSAARYGRRVNPQWARLLRLLEMDVRYGRCVGAELFTTTAAGLWTSFRDIAFTMLVTITHT